jgi:hypothetical protein
MSPEEREFSKIIAVLGKEPGVSIPNRGRKNKGFGSNALRTNDKIFAFLSSESELVVKLPSERVDELVASGSGKRFEPRKNGKAMKQWFVAASSAKAKWLEYAREAWVFVASSK